MRRRLLRFLGTFVFRWAWLMGPLVIAATVASIRLIDSSMQFDTSLVAFLPQRGEHEQKIREAVRDYRAMEPVLAVIHARRPGGEQALKDLTAIFAEQLDNQSYFNKPVWRTDPLLQSYYSSLPDLRLIQLLTADDWASLRQLLGERINAELIRKRAYLIDAFVPRAMKRQSTDDPLGALEIVRERLASSLGPTRLPTRDGYFMTEDGQSAGVLLYPVLAPENARSADRTLRFLERNRDALFEHYPAWRDQFDIDFSGSLIETARAVQSVRGDLEKIACAIVPLAFLLLVLVFRKAEAFFFVFLPPFVGVYWTLGLATQFFGGINAVAAAFILVTAATGLQSSIHLYHRFTLELYRTKHYYRALAQSYVETARGLFTTALVLAAIFFSLFLTSLWGRGGVREVVQVARDSQGLGQLGLVVGMGILCNLAACLLTLPLLAALKHALSRGRVKHVPLFRFALDRIYEPALQRPHATIVAMLVIAVICGFYSGKLQFYPRFASVANFFYRSQTPPGEADNERERETFPRPGRPLVAVVEGATLEAALAQNDRLYRNLRLNGGKYGVLSVDSLRTVLPSIESQKASLNELRSLDIGVFRRQIERANLGIGFRPSVYEPFLKALQSLKDSSANPHFIVFSLAEGMSLVNTVQRYVTSRQADGDALVFYVATSIYPREAGFAASSFAEMRQDFGRGVAGMELIGDPAVELEMGHFIKLNLSVMILLSIGAILLALAIHFKHGRLTWVTLVPVAAEILWLCGLMAMTGLRIHFFTVLAMPLFLSLALDNALQVSQYYSDRQPCTVRYAMSSVGRAVALSCAMIALFYGTLALTAHPGLHDFGVTVLLGCAVTLIGSVMFLPALLQLFGRGQSFAEALDLTKTNE